MSDFAFGLSLAVVGVGTVFFALIVTGVLVTAIGQVTKEGVMAGLIARVTKRQALRSGKESANLPEATLTGGLDRHKLVLLAAAASVALKRPARIRRVRFVAHKQIPTSWRAVGRTEHSIKESID